MVLLSYAMITKTPVPTLLLYKENWWNVKQMPMKLIFRSIKTIAWNSLILYFHCQLTLLLNPTS